MDDAVKAWADAHVGEYAACRHDDGVFEGTVSKWSSKKDASAQGGMLVTFTVTSEAGEASFTAVPPLSEEQVAAIEQGRADEQARQEAAARQATLDTAPEPQTPTADTDVIVARMADALGADPDALKALLSGGKALA